MFGQHYYKEYQIQGGGSGFIISDDGYIVTNHHVAGNASKVVVTMTDGNKYDAQIIGSDVTTDVCLLKIEGRRLPFLRFANSDNTIIGE
jgi:serine protease Do